jgi:hypothetical protein
MVDSNKHAESGMGDFHVYECVSGSRDGQAKTRRNKGHAVEGGIIDDLVAADVRRLHLKFA